MQPLLVRDALTLTSQIRHCHEGAGSLTVSPLAGQTHAVAVHAVIIPILLPSALPYLIH
jgi:hypothetical protein